MSIPVKLKRAYQDVTGTHGALYFDGKLICYTLERPWLENQSKVSCIPTGTYECEPHNGAHFKNVWHVKDVPDREAILIHCGNTIADTEGCILVGQLRTETGVGQSQLCMKKLKETLPDNFTLEVS